MTKLLFSLPVGYYERCRETGSGAWQMCSVVKLPFSNPGLEANCNHFNIGKLVGRRPLNPRLLNRRFAYISPDNASPSKPSISSQFTTTVGTASSTTFQLSQWSLTQRHILTLNFIACAAAFSATWLFGSAIPTLLAFKRAAESLEKLLDVTREELPDTMAAVRFSGMEISDLTAELSDLSQEISQGVKSSTRAVRVAEERLRRLTNISPSVPTQEVIPIETKAAGPVLARTARGIKEGIVKGRAVLQMFFTLTKFSRMALNYLKSRAKV